jgi:hypothetical protein
MVPFAAVAAMILYAFSKTTALVFVVAGVWFVNRIPFDRPKK